MSEEMKNAMEEVETVDVKDIDELYPDYEEYEDDGFLKKLAVGFGSSVIVGGAATLAIKNRAKIKAWKEERDIRKLEKKGYTIIPNEMVENAEVVSDCNDQDDDSEE